MVRRYQVVLLSILLLVAISASSVTSPTIAEKPGPAYSSASSDTSWRYNKTNGHYYRLTTGRYHGISTEQKCPDGSGTFVDSCLTPTWLDAEIEAQALGGHLVTINDAAENQWLYDTFGTHEYWIGFTDHDLYSSEHNWVWASGQAVTFTNWDNGQPDDQDFGEDCAHYNHQAGQLKKWNDLGNYLSPLHPELPLCGIVESATAPPPDPCAGNALLFDGSNDLVLVSHAASLNLGTQGTIEFWIMPLTPAAGVYNVLGKRDGCGTIEYQCARDPSNLFHGTHGGQCTLSAGDIASNTWTHVALTFSSTACRIYLNGVLAGQQASTASAIATTAPLRLGISGTCPEYFSGMLDEVRIWNVAREAWQIMSTYQHPLGPSVPGLVAYYKFDETAADQNVVDSSGQGNHGTLGSSSSIAIDDPTRVPSWTPTVCSQATSAPLKLHDPSLRVRSYPNPFNPETTIEYFVPRAGHVTLRVFDVSGRLVRVLVDGGGDSGEHAVSWDGHDDAGSAVTSGVYFVRLDAAGDIRIAKIVLLK